MTAGYVLHVLGCASSEVPEVLTIKRGCGCVTIEAPEALAFGSGPLFSWKHAAEEAAALRIATTHADLHFNYSGQTSSNFFSKKLPWVLTFLPPDFDENKTVL